MLQAGENQIKHTAEYGPDVHGSVHQPIEVTLQDTTKSDALLFLSA